MAPRKSPMRHGQETSQTQNRLSLEQLETRLAFALDGIEANLQSLMTPSVGNPPAVVNASPTIVNAPRLTSGTEVRNRTVTASVLGADDQGEANLRYTWQVASQPALNSVAFATNGSNAAKNNTLTFTRPGNYAVNVNVRDNSGASTTRELQFKVVPTLSALQVKGSDGRILNREAVVQLNSNTTRFSVQSLDQFNATLSTETRHTWQTVSAPSGGVATFQNETSGTKITFNRAGLYRLRVQSGNQSFNVSVNVTQALRSLQLTSPTGTVIAANQTLNVTEASQRLTVRGLDQFNQPMTSTPNITWTTNAAPAGGNVATTFSNGTTTLTFNRLGNYQIRASAGAAALNFTAQVTPSLASIRATTAASRILSPGAAVGLTVNSAPLNAIGLDQFGAPLVQQPAIVWQSTTKPTGATVSLKPNANAASAEFSQAGTYGFRATSGTRSLNVALNVTQTLTSLAVSKQDGANLEANSVIQVHSTKQDVSIRGLDQFKKPMQSLPAITFSSLRSPAGGTATAATTSNTLAVSFNRAGEYVARIQVGALTRTLTFNVNQAVTRINVTPGTTRLEYQATQLFQARALDQFNAPMSTTPVFTWSATGGTITTAGSFTTGAVSGNFSVRANVGTISGTAVVTVAAPASPTSLRDAEIAALVESFYADGRLDRIEMIDILRSAGDDGIVNATELADFRYLVSMDASFEMPDYVRDLAKDVVTDNPANLRFKGQAAGNLTAGSTSTLLNNLVNKWFLGADAKQGMLGDCYFIASLVAIADRNPQAVRNLFIDNGDNTFTVRFFGGTLGHQLVGGSYTAGFTSGSGTADYVTVDRRLPAYSNGTLAYSGSGQSVASASTTLWIALAEKAYAQWNETRNAGRDGTNQYASIEGGWMSNVNAQVLGYNSTNYSFSSTPKQTLVNALAAGRAVTLGTVTSPNAGFVGGHAYIITGYDPSSDRFSVYNPWGNTHPAPVTWAQLQANCSLFVVTDPTGAQAINAASVSSAVEVQWIGNWTEVVLPAADANETNTHTPTTIAELEDCESKTKSSDAVLSLNPHSLAGSQPTNPNVLSDTSTSRPTSLRLNASEANLEALDLIMASLNSRLA
jgi:hypothetical protein